MNDIATEVYDIIRFGLVPHNRPVVQASAKRCMSIQPLVRKFSTISAHLIVENFLYFHSLPKSNAQIKIPKAMPFTFVFAVNLVYSN